MFIVDCEEDMIKNTEFSFSYARYLHKTKYKNF